MNKPRFQPFFELSFSEEIYPTKNTNHTFTKRHRISDHFINQTIQMVYSMFKNIIELNKVQIKGSSVPSLGSCIQIIKFGSIIKNTPYFIDILVIT
ncbi:hypothetical protein EKN41_17140 [Enterobacter hormaechei]|nr:hypothetical protein EKN41_17140 [Enterobacter hormaechei]